MPACSIAARSSLDVYGCYVTGRTDANNFPTLNAFQRPSSFWSATSRDLSHLNIGDRAST